MKTLKGDKALVASLRRQSGLGVSLATDASEKAVRQRRVDAEFKKRKKKAAKKKATKRRAGQKARVQAKIQKKGK